MPARNGENKMTRALEFDSEEAKKIDAAADKLARYLPGRCAVLLGTDFDGYSESGVLIRLVRPDCPVPADFYRVAWPAAMPDVHEDGLSVVVHFAPVSERMERIYGPPNVPGALFVVDGIEFAAWGSAFPEGRSIFVRVTGADYLGGEWVVLSKNDPPLAEEGWDPEGASYDPDEKLGPFYIGRVVVP